MDERGQPALLVLSEPAVDGFGFAWLMQPTQGDRIGGHAIGNLEQPGRHLPQIGSVVAVAHLLQFPSLVWGQG